MDTDFYSRKTCDLYAFIYKCFFIVVCSVSEAAAQIKRKVRLHAAKIAISTLRACV